MSTAESRRIVAPHGLTIAGYSWPLFACIAATLFLRCGSFGAGALLGFHLAYISRTFYPIDPTFVGLLTASFYAVELLGAPISGSLGDRIGHRVFLLIGPIAGAISAQILGMTTLLPMLFVVMAFKGLSSATSIPATLAYLSFATRDNDAVRTRALAWFEVANVAGIGVGGLLGGLFYSALGGWAFTAVAALYVLAFLLLWSMSGETGPAVRRERRSLWSYHHLFQSRSFVRFIPAWLCVNAFVGLWAAYTPFLLRNPVDNGQLLQAGYDPGLIGVIYGVVGLIFGVGIIMWGRMLAGRPRTVGMYAGIAGAAACAGLLFLLNHSGMSWGPIQLGLLVLLAIALFFASGFTPAALAQLADIAEEQREDRGAVMGLYSVFFGIGQVSGALAGGPAARVFGADGLIFLTVILVVLAFFSIQALHASQHRPAEPSSTGGA